MPGRAGHDGGERYPIKSGMTVNEGDDDEVYVVK